MKTPEQIRIEQAEEQAALWVARLDGSRLSATDGEELNAWLKRDPKNRALLDRYRHFDTALGETLGELAAAGQIERSRGKAGSRRRFLRACWLSGAALSAAAALAFVFKTETRSPASESFDTPAALRRSLSLEDGTRVELNARSRLQVFHEEGIRRVRLDAGEAYFEVSKDPSRPFVVETSRGSVRVTGTVFDVNAEARRSLSVTVVEGSVLVTPQGEKAVALAAGDQLQDGGRRRLAGPALANALAWRRGMAVFEASPMAEAVAIFARYHDRSIEVSQGASELGVGGRFSLDDLDTFLAALAETQPVTVVRKTDGSLRVRLKNEP